MAALCTVETAEQNEHRLSKPRTKEKPWHAARAAAKVVSRDYYSLVSRSHPTFLGKLICYLSQLTVANKVATYKSSSSSVP